MTTHYKPLILIMIYKTTINKNNLKQLVIFQCTSRSMPLFNEL